MPFRPVPPRIPAQGPTGAIDITLRRYLQDLVTYTEELERRIEALERATIGADG